MPPHSRIPSRRLWVALVATLLTAAGHARAQVDPPAFPRIAPYEDEHGSGGFVEIEMLAPADSVIVVEGTSSLERPQWTPVGDPILTSGLPIIVAVPTYSGEASDAIPRQFFRFQVTTYDVRLTDDGKSTVLTLGGATPAALVHASLRRQWKTDIFPTEPVDPWKPWEGGRIESANPEDLLGKGGARYWIVPGATDDPAVADRYPVSDVPQRSPLPDDPVDVGRGKMEEGFPGDSTLPRPRDFTLDPPEPGPNADKPFRPEVPDVREELPQVVNPQVQDSGRHLRLVFDVGVDGEVVPQEGAVVPGDALRQDPDEPGQPFWPRNVGLMSWVWIVRSTVAGAGLPEGIYFIGAAEDPFAVRSYDPPPPFRGSHGTFEEGEGRIRVIVPILEKDADLAGLVVSLHEYVEPGDFEVLTPAVFLRNERSFRKIREFRGEEISRWVRESQLPRPTALHAQVPARPSELAAPPAPTVTQLFRSGTRAAKFNFVVIGDGFADTQADQDAFNTYVENTVMRDLLSRDVHPEILNGINVFRINTFSQQSGITQVNTNGVVTNSVNTALQYRYSGVWNRCWMEPGPNTVALMDAAINALVPEVDGVAVVLNVASGGGCARSGHFAVTRASSWATFAHEFGHFFASQKDEYQCNQGAPGCGTYGGGEPPEVNQTQVTTRDQIKWNVWIPPTRPVPTAQANIVDTDQDVGLFPGATRGNQQWWTGIYRPSWRGRMNNNSPPHNPVGYTAVRDTARGFQQGDFRRTVVGDFDGDKRTDVVLLDDRQLSLYLARDRNVGPVDPITGTTPRTVTGVLEPTWYHTDLLRNAAQTRSWEIRRNDILVPGDFDGDGRTDLYVINLVDWNIPYLCLLRSLGNGFEPVRRYDRELPGWDDMKRADEFYAGDFNGDGRDDLMVYNGRDWNVPYFIMLRSTGTQLVYSRRYDQYLPGWEMGRNEKFYVGDFNGDGRQEVISHNTLNWNQVHLMVFTSTGGALSLADRYYGTIMSGNSLFWTMRRQDELIPVNFNGDDATDLVIFNGRDWTPEYLALFASSRAARLEFRRRYEDVIPGWDMRRRDRFHAADVNGDGDQDLVVYNALNWSTQYLGILRSNGADGVQGSWQSDWIGGWNLGAGDAFHVAEFRGAAGWQDLFVYNQGWFGLLRSQQNRYALEAIYRKWIHNHRYHAFGFW